MTPILLFTGKGGVGKTSLACATALSLARQGGRVLLVSTDPASNLDEVLGLPLGPEARPVPGAPGLEALNLDPVEAARVYRDRLLAPLRGVLPPALLASMEEQLSGACTVEIAAFDEFSRRVGERRTHDHVIFDTAPTGHTLRLLELPAAWSRFLESSAGSASCLGPLAGLQTQKALYAAARDTLQDPARTTIVLVARPDAASLAEAERTRLELAGIGLRNLRFALNGLFKASTPDDPVAAAWERRGREALAALPAGLAALPREEHPLLPFNPVGLPALEALLDRRIPAAARPEPSLDGSRSLESLLDELAVPGHGLILCVGKGGVGKTRIAEAVAAGLRRRGLPVDLVSTDPASASSARIDPKAVTRDYADEVLAQAGAGLDARGRALLEEDLRSPCTEEVAVFRAFARLVAGGERRCVVMDTAPTGHTLLLLDAAEAYHREVLRRPSGAPEAVLQLLPRLRDPRFTRVLLVTLSEPTPVHEARQLADDLRRAGITPFAWIVNQSLAPLEIRDPLLLARRSAEAACLDEIRGLTERWSVVPWTENG